MGPGPSAFLTTSGPMCAFIGKPWAAPHDLSKHLAPSSSASRQTDGRAERRARCPYQGPEVRSHQRPRQLYGGSYMREASSQTPPNKKRPTRRRFSSGTDHGCREPITSSSWVPPSSPSGGLPGGASIRPGRFPRCRCAPVPAGECRTPGEPSRGRGSAG